MKELFEKIKDNFYFKSACAILIVFGWFAAAFCGIYFPISTGYWFWAIPTGVAVGVAFPSYFKALKSITGIK